MIRVLVKASSTTTRAALERLLRANPRFEVIDSSSTAGLREGSIEAFGPDVAVAQVGGQDDELVQELLDWAAAGGPVVVLVDDPAAAWTGDALRAGVKALLPTSLTGQEISALARHCDVLSPMIYPSHFFGMGGYARPGDAPEHFISTSMDRFQKITQGNGVVIRPWLQAFHWRTRTYSPKYIEVQVQTAKSKGGIGFLFWNAANNYSKPFAAMPAMRAAKGQFFRGDELPAQVARASKQLEAHPVAPAPAAAQ